MNQTSAKNEIDAAVEMVAEVLANRIGSPVTPKIEELALAVIEKLRIIREPGPHDVVVCFVDESSPKPDVLDKEGKPVPWWSRTAMSLKLFFVGAKILFLPVGLDLKRVRPEDMPVFRARIVEMLALIDSHMTTAQEAQLTPEPQPPVPALPPAAAAEAVETSEG